MVNEIIDKEAEFVTLLEDKWTPANTRGYKPITSFEVAKSIDNIGAPYPSLVVQAEDGSPGGDTGYTFMSQNGPGANSGGTIICTIRAQDDEDNKPVYEAGGTPARSDVICEEIASEIKRICWANPTGGTTDFETLGAYKGPHPPDDDDEDPTVRLYRCTVNYSYVESAE